MRPAPSASAMSLFCKALPGQQHDARTKGQPNAGELGPNQIVKHFALFVRQHNL